MSDLFERIFAGAMRKNGLPAIAEDTTWDCGELPLERLSASNLNFHGFVSLRHVD
jgi:hypothetical protein